MDFYLKDSFEFLNFQFVLNDIIENIGVLEQIFPKIFFFNNTFFLFVIIGEFDGLIRLDINNEDFIDFFLYVKKPNSLLINYCKWFYWIFAAQ